MCFVLSNHGFTKITCAACASCFFKCFQEEIQWQKATLFPSAVPMIDWRVRVQFLTWISAAKGGKILFREPILVIPSSIMYVIHTRHFILPFPSHSRPSRPTSRREAQTTTFRIILSGSSIPSHIPFVLIIAIIIAITNTIQQNNHADSFSQKNLSE